MRDILDFFLKDLFRQSQPPTLDEVLDELRAHEVEPEPEEVIELGERCAAGGYHAYGTSSIPAEIASLIPQLLEEVSRERILDPWAGIGSLLQQLSLKPNGPVTAIGIIPDPVLHEIAISIDNRIKENLKDLQRSDYSLDFLQGNPLKLLSSLKGGFDVVVSALPFGGQPSKEDVQSFELVTGKRWQDNLGSMILIASALKLKPEGIGLYIVPPTFASLGKSHATIQIMNELGLCLTRYLSLRRGILPFMPVHPALVAVQRGKQEEFWAAEMQENPQRMEVLVRNFHERKEGKDPTLGVLVKLERFRGYEALRAKLDYERLLKRIEIPSVPLKDIVESISSPKLGLQPEFHSHANAIYLPSIGASDVRLSPEEFTLKPQNYIQLVLDPKKISADYFCKYLNSNLGQVFRRTLFRGTTIPKITLNALGEALPVPVPPLMTQKDVLKQDTRVRNLVTDFEALRAELWKRPQQVSAIRNKIDRVNREETFAEWLDTLPFPIASILWTYHTAGNLPKEQFRLLIKFFEALSEFLATILLSAAKRDSALWSECREFFARDPKKLETSSFGTWVGVTEMLSKRFRGLINEPKKEMQEANRQRAINALVCQNSEFHEALLSKQIIAALQKANEFRNDYDAHFGALGEAQAEQLLASLDQQLASVREVFSQHWQYFRMVQATNKMSFRQDVFWISLALLQGTRTPFEQIEVQLKEPLEKDSLYLLDEEAGVALKILPLIRMGSSPTSAENACYFYNRKQSDGVRFVSYHFEKEATKLYDLSDISQLLEEFTATSFPPK